MEMAAAAWAFVKSAFAATAAGTATAAQVATVVAVNVAGSAALSAVSMALMKPNVGSRPPGELVIDPNAGIPFAMGERIGVAGSLAYKNTYGKDNEYKGVVRILSGAGPIGGYLSFTADREPVDFDPATGAAQGRYGGEWWRDKRLGTQPDTALTPKAFGAYTLPGWNVSSRLSGKACVLDTLRQDSKWSVFPQGEPDPLDVITGIRGYDHRLDSTMPGGSGSVRLNDRATWPIITNPIIGDLNWCLGLRENGKTVGGLGVSVAGVDWDAYTVAANIADMNGWKVCAYPRSDEDKAEVRAGLLQAGGALISRRAGLVSVVSRGAAKTPVMTVSVRDTAGPIELDTAANVLNRLNTITPRYVSEAHEWKQVAAAPVTSSVYVEEDRGRVRGDARDYPYVSSAKQAAELAALDVAHSREGIAGRWPMKGYCRDIQPGETFAVNEPGLLLHGMEMLCLDREYDPATDVASIVFVSETTGKYAWAMGQAASPSPTPALDARRDLNPPAPAEWDVTPRPPTTGGVETPTIDVSGGVDNPRAEAVVIQYRPVEYDDSDPPAIIPLPDESSTDEEERAAWAALDWTAWYDGPIDLASTAITGVDPGVSYWVRVYYRSPLDGVSKSLVRGPVTAPQLVAGDTATLAGRPSAEVTGQIDATQAAVEALEETYGDTASAAASAAAAALSAAAADTARANAVIAQGAASTSAANALTQAGIAATQAGLAGTARTQAETARSQAQTAASDAADDALAAAGSASTAASSATAAGGSATAAAGSASTAATHATNAGNSATAANASRVAAESARDDADDSATAASTSASSAATSAGAAGVSAAAANTARTQAETARGQAQTAATQASEARDDAEGAASSASTSAGAAAGSATAAGGSATAAAGSASTAATHATNAGNSATAAAASAVSAGSARDDAEDAATAAAGSASAASTSASEAGTFASAANTARTQAETARSQAQTFANNASDSATTAGAAASTATTQAGLAATARDTAAGHATAASNSATTASGYADDAETAAAAATSARITAEAARDTAGASATAASGSASSASASASDAAASASAASTSQTQAETARSQAQTAATQAASARDTAEGHAASASTSAGAAATSASAAGSSASAAAGSASSASTSASNAAASATAADASRVAAEAALSSQGRSNLVARNSITNAGQLIDLGWGLSGWGVRMIGAGANMARSFVLGPLLQNTPYSVSFKARLTEGTSQVINIDLFPDTLPEVTRTITSTEQTFTWNGLTSAHADMTGSVTLRFFRNPLPSGVTVEITDIKFEQGATATAWTPSPRDARDYAGAAATSANSASASSTAAGASATAASGSATTATTQAGAALTYAGQSSDARDAAITARDQAQTAASTAGGHAVTASTAASTATSQAAAATASATLAASYNRPGANLVRNSTGVFATTGWTAAGAWGALNDLTYGPRFETTGTGTSAIAQASSEYIPVTAGEWITFQADLMRRGATGGGVHVRVGWYDGAKAQLSAPNDWSLRLSATANREYGEVLSREAQAPAGAAFVRVQVFIESVSSATAHGVRRIKLERGRLPATGWSDDQTDVLASASITSAASVAAGADGIARAVQGVTLDVNGYISGYRSENDGSVSSFEILAGVFAVRALGTGARTEFIDGIWYAYDATNTVRSSWGRPHGASGHGLTLWTGLNSTAKGSELKSNAYVYVSINTTGGPRFGGSDVPTGGDVDVTTPGGVTRTGRGYNAIAGSSWQTLTTTTINDVVAGQLIAASVDLGVPSVTGARIFAEYRLVQGATVLDGPIAVDFGDAEFVAPLGMNGITASSTTTFSVQMRINSGGSLNAGSPTPPANGSWGFSTVRIATETQAGLLLPVEKGLIASAVQPAALTSGLAGKANASHTHAAADVTSGTFADARIPALAISKTTGLQTALDGKAAASHTHAASDVTSGTFADARIPALAINKVTNLQTSLDAKLTNTGSVISTYADRIHVGDSGTHGYCRVVRDASRTGYIAGYSPAGTRLWYMGYATGTNVVLTCESTITTVICNKAFHAVSLLETSEHLLKTNLQYVDDDAQALVDVCSTARMTWTSLEDGRERMGFNADGLREIDPRWVEGGEPATPPVYVPVEVEEGEAPDPMPEGVLWDEATEGWLDTRGLVFDPELEAWRTPRRIGPTAMLSTAYAAIRQVANDAGALEATVAAQAARIETLESELAAIKAHLGLN